jgi:membrane-associated PAP2 superfamily phosphatase
MRESSNVTLLLGMCALLAANLVMVAAHWLPGKLWPYAVVALIYCIAIALIVLSQRQRVRAHKE